VNVKVHHKTSVLRSEVLIGYPIFPLAASDIISKISMGLLFSFESKTLLMISARKARNNNGFPKGNPEECPA